MKTLLIADSHHGIYCPQTAAEYLVAIHPDAANKRADDLGILLAGPDAEDYWDAWDSFMDAFSVEIDGTEYTISHNEDVWLLPSIDLDGFRFADDMDSVLEFLREMGDNWEMGDVLSWDQVPPSDREDADEDDLFVKWGEMYFNLNEFMRVDGDPIFDGSTHLTNTSGVMLALSTDGERYIIKLVTD